MLTRIKQFLFGKPAVTEETANPTKTPAFTVGPEVYPFPIPSIDTAVVSVTPPAVKTDKKAPAKKPADTAKKAPAKKAPAAKKTVAKPKKPTATK